MTAAPTAATRRALRPAELDWVVGLAGRYPDLARLPDPGGPDPGSRVAPPPPTSEGARWLEAVTAAVDAGWLPRPVAAAWVGATAPTSGGLAAAARSIWARWGWGAAAATAGLAVALVTLVLLVL